MVGIIHYNMGNITSVINAYNLLGINAVVVRQPGELKAVSHIILPGVGAFRDGINFLHQLGFVTELKEQVVKNKKPFLGICLGMQLMFGQGSEGGKFKGLGFLQGKVTKLPAKDVILPHVGWNTVTPLNQNTLLKLEGDMYFVHSFHVEPKDKSIVTATCNYGGVFPVMVEKDNMFGIQCHPEKSHKSGRNILASFSKV